MTDVFSPAPVVRVPVTGGGSFPVHRVYCVGRNYAEHAAEMGHDARESPFFFMKPADAVVAAPAAGEGLQPAPLPIDYPTLTADLHHEVELVVALGERACGQPVEPAQALDLVFGYAVGLDLTRRDLQAVAKKAGRPWCIAKGFDQSAPVGALRRAADWQADCPQAPRAGAIALCVNGQSRQQGDLAAMIWNVAESIAWLSRAWALRPGDLIFTGTPAGVGAVHRGDRLDARVQGLPPLVVDLR